MEDIAVQVQRAGGEPSWIMKVTIDCGFRPSFSELHLTFFFYHPRRSVTAVSALLQLSS